MSTPGAGRSGVQQTLDDLGTPLSEVTFVVVDLETTGGSPADSEVTEIGAVKVRRGEILGEFHTLVNPGRSIPPFIAVLTGITDRMVAAAPGMGAVLPAFLEFSRGCVLVAHNAGFDISFLESACTRAGRAWPRPVVVDTVQLARQVVADDEVPDRRLSTLARHFGSGVTPDHRALTDARATVDVLHALLARVGNLGVHSLEELCTYSRRVPHQTRRKHSLAADLPHAPGVYLFRAGDGEVLYVGTSTDIRSRVRSYFTAAERRSRMAEMVRRAESVTAVVCQTPLEARVRELRLIAEHAPRYNRRSRAPERRPWLKLTAEAHPRLSVVREVRDDGAAYIGPFPGTAAAEEAMAALHDAFALRRCGGRLPATPRKDARPCAVHDLGRCDAPCVPGPGAASHRDVAGAARAAMLGDSTPVVAAALSRAARLAAQERFEEAARCRDRLLAFVTAADRAQRLRPLAESPELAAARRHREGGWELVLVRHGRLAGTAVSPRGADPMPYLAALTRTAEVVARPCPPQPAASCEETEQVLRWLEEPGVRLVTLDGEWSCPRDAAGRDRGRLLAAGHRWPGPQA